MNNPNVQKVKKFKQHKRCLRLGNIDLYIQKDNTTGQVRIVLCIFGGQEIMSNTRTAFGDIIRPLMGLEPGTDLLLDFLW